MFSNVRSHHGNDAIASARGDDFDKRTKALKAEVKHGKELQSRGNESAVAAGACVAVGAVIAAPLIAIAPPVGLVGLAGVAAAIEGVEEASKYKQKGRAMVRCAAYRLDMNELGELVGTGTPYSLVASLVAAGVVRPLPRGPNDWSDAFYSVVPRPDIAAVLKGSRFNTLTEQQRHNVTKFLQKIVEMGPILEALQEVEAKLHDAIANNDSENAKIYSKQIADLRALWACDGSESVQDPAIETNESERMLNFLRQELTTELEKGFRQDPLRVRRLRSDLRSWGVMMDQAKLEAEVGDLIDL